MRIPSRATLAAVGVLAGMVSLAGCGPVGEAAPQTITVVVGAAAPIEAEVASTDEQKRVGLMGRTQVPPGTGMAFVYDSPVRHQFWMGGVELPLSIVWAMDGRVVGVAEMQPCPAADSTCPRYAPDSDYQLAVETTGGTFTEASVQIGDPVTTS